MKYFLRTTAKTFINFSLKALFVFFLVGLVGIGWTFWLGRQLEESKIDNTFSVSGESKRLVKPDIAEITVGSFLEGQDFAKLQNETNTKVNSAIEAIKELGISEEDIQTTSYDVTPEWDYETNEITGYSVNVELKITIRNTDTQDELPGKVITISANNGLNETRSLNYKIDNEEEVLEELKLEAVDDAKSKAKELADKSGIRLGKVVNLYEGGDFYPYYYGEGVAEDSVSVLAPDTIVEEDINIQTGQFELSSHVTLVYKIR